MQHIEQHFSGSDTVRDVVIGMADGLTVPFALAAGISGALTSTHIVVTAGLAEIAAGSIAMGLGGYLAARSDVEHFLNERRREEQEIVEKADVEKQEIVDIFQQYGVTAEECAPIVTALVRKPEAWRDFMMRFELGLEEPNPKRAIRSALTIGTSYVVGGLVPLAPYMLMHDSGPGVGCVGRDHLAGVGCVWLCEGPLHRRSEAEGRVADGPGWQPLAARSGTWFWQ
jgi:VIT1/CCC1 family predicted Fe2+/Mn2+ transporter